MIRSIRGRLAFWYLLVSLGSLTLVAGMVYYRTRGLLMSDATRHARERAEEVRNAYATGAASGTQAALDDLAATAGAVHEDLRYAVFRPGPSVAIVTNAPPEVVRALFLAGASAALGGMSVEFDLALPDPRAKTRLFRVLAQPGRLPDGGRYYAVTAVSLRRIQVALNILWKNLLVMIPAGVALALLGLWALLTKSFKPIDLLVEETRKLTAESLSRRLPLPGTKDEIHRLVLMLNEMIARLERSFANTRQFSMDVSHELRTPLTALKGEMELALMRGDPREYARVLESGLEEVNRLADLVEKLLLLSRADLTDEKPDARPLSLELLVAEVFEMSAVLAAARGIGYTLEQQAPGEVAADRARLTQLLWNLVDNALKFTPAGGSVRIASGRETGKEGVREGARVWVAVSDTGPGIPESEQGRLFERFYRGDPARARAPGGSGLGLSIARWIARVHGGDIQVASAPGRGSTFTFRMPGLPPGAGLGVAGVAGAVGGARIPSPRPSPAAAGEGDAAGAAARSGAAGEGDDAAGATARSGAAGEGDGAGAAAGGAS